MVVIKYSYILYKRKKKNSNTNVLCTRHIRDVMEFIGEFEEYTYNK